MRLTACKLLYIYVWCLTVISLILLIILKGKHAMKKYEHLPIYGIGPVYVVSILLPTIVAILLRSIPVFTSGKEAFLPVLLE